jgi:hypothetical protein
MASEFQNLILTSAKNRFSSFRKAIAVMNSIPIAGSNTVVASMSRVISGIPP